MTRRFFSSKELITCQRAFEAGNLAGLYDCLGMCEVMEWIVPKWAHEGIAEILIQKITGDNQKKRGKFSKWKDQYRNDQIDWTRADTVRECLDHSIPWENVFEAAAMLLDGTFAGGVDEEAVRKSYLRYQKRSKENPFRYYKSKFIKLEGEDKIPRHNSKLWSYIQKMRRNLGEQ